ncbi:MAG TPA: hypothetical protein RMH99_17100 [Sandaracinaceae bacterium LLY-WYZ-13_1]|nr:hypothetical protein [Sandaracinaceae bacterium LLY-WYZ-13_1]
MPRAHGLAGRALGLAVATAVLCVPMATRAQRGPVRVALGELGASEGGPRTARALEAAIERALRDREDVRLVGAGRAQLVLRGSVVRLERRRVGRALEVRCEVSVIVADARGGSIRAMLRGRAGARGSDPTRLRANALRAAVRGALRPLAAHGRALARAR